MVSALLEEHTTTKSRITLGISLLDRENPGWRYDIDLDNLKMYDSEHCILGQLYGGYNAGLHALGLPDGIDHGFVEPTLEWVQALK